MFRPLLAASLLISSFAAAQITAVGNLGPGNHSWAGTVTMTGDVTVPSGATLTIQPGTVVTAAATDSQGSGDLNMKVELIVEGTLSVSGVTNGGVTLTGAGTGAQAWGGIVVREGGTATLSSATLDEMQGGLRVYVGATGTTTTLTVSNSVISGSTLGFRSTGGTGTGTFQFTNTRIAAANGSDHAAGTLTFTDCTLSDATNDNVLDQTGGALSAVGTAFVNNGDGVFITGGTSSSFDRCTLSYNQDNGLETSVSSGHTTTVVSSVISHNAGYGIYRGSTGTMSVTSSNLWGNSATVSAGVPTANANSPSYNAFNVTGLSLSFGNANNVLSENPLFVDASARNYRLTHRSPSRKTGASGVDQGALPYTNNQTSTLQGTIWENLTLSGAQTVTGDLTVAPGVTLTINPGATLTFAADDLQGGNNNAAKAELAVLGTLTAIGTSGSPITFTGAGTGTQAWGGFISRPGSTATVANAVINESVTAFYAMAANTGGTTSLTVSNSAVSESQYGVRTFAGAGNGTFQFTNTRIAASNGSDHAAGTLTFTDCTLSDATNDNVLDQTGGALSAVGTAFVNNGNGVFITGGTSSSFDRCTLSYNQDNGLETSVSSGHTTTVVSSVISHNAGYGIYRGSTGTMSVTSSNLWGNSATVSAGVPTANANSPSYNAFNVTGLSLSFGNANNVLSENPLFVDASARNYRLTHRSPSRKTGASGVDQGALPYTNNQTSTLQGTIWENLTLSGAQTVTGDLTVAPGVTLTINPGATLTFAADDLQGGNNNAAKAELAVLGTLTAIGTSGSPITFTGAGTGTQAWGGFVLRPAASASLAHALISEAVTGLYLMQANSGGTTSLTMNNSTVSGGLYGFRTFAGAGTGTWNIATTDFTGLTNGSDHAGGTLTVQASTFTGATNDNVLDQTGGTATFERTLFANNSDGVYVTGGTSTSFDRCTLTGNQDNALETSVSSGHTTTVVSSIISHNAGYGVYRSSTGTMSITYSNIWGNSATWQSGSNTNSLSYNAFNVTGLNLGNVTPQFNKSENPLYADFANSVFTLQSTSPSRGAGASGVDQGAYPYTVGAVATVTVSPATASVNAGGVVGFAAQARDAMGNIVGNATFTWGVSPSAGSISAAGVLMASCTPGTYTAAVTAQAANGVTGNATVTINIGPASQVTITPATPSVKSQATQQFTAVVRDACNNVINGQAITWSSNTSAGTITSGGLFTASCQRGSYATGVTATAGALSGSVPVTVIAGDPAAIAVTPMSVSVPAGTTQQFAASVADGCGNTVSSPVTWATTAPGCSINASGLLTAGQVNGTTPAGVTATLGARTGTADLTVTGGMGQGVATVVVSPNNATLTVGGTQTFTATAFDAQGNMVFSPPTTWTATAAAGTINAQGTFTAGNTPGSFSNAVTATISGVQGHASVLVEAGAVASVTVTPTTVTVAPGGTASFTAVARDAAGNIVSAPVTWSAQAAVGAITQGGVLTATTSPGNYPASVTATVGAHSATASVTVMNGALSQLLVTPASTMVQAGGTVAFMASGVDSSGNPVAVTPTWSVVSGGGTISGAGIFTAGTMAGTFGNTVRAEANGLTAFASVAVTPGPVLSVAVTPMSGTVNVGGSLQFTAEARDAFNNLVATGFTWSAQAAAGTITQGGFFTAGVDPGSYPNSITAAANGVTGLASVTVMPSGAGGGGGSNTGGGAGTGGGTATGGGDGMTGGGTAMGGGDGMTGGGDGMTGGGAGATGGGSGTTGGGDGATGGGSGISGNSSCGCTTVDPSFLVLGLLGLLRRRRR